MNSGKYAWRTTSSIPTQEEAIGDKFFAALERVREIHANCRALLRTHHQRAGLELMDAMAAHQEAAYERLCRCACSMVSSPCGVSTVCQ